MTGISLLCFLTLLVFCFVILKGSKDKVKEREEFGDKTGQTECKVISVVILRNSYGFCCN